MPVRPPRVVAPASWFIVRLSVLEKKAPAYLRQLGQKVKAIDAALAEGQKDYQEWPKSFEERLVVGLLLSELFTLSAENHLLELDGEKMDIVESICRQKGISYEEFTREVIDTFLGKSNDESGTRDEPLDLSLIHI